jgi:hypothetical protein
VRFRREDIIYNVLYFDCVKCLDSICSVTTGCNPINRYQYFERRDACLVSVDSEMIEPAVATELSYQARTPR